ncbi:MAG: SufD family Fe-S cluster assembly protein [Candidatus Eremiobacteraeota bacterium]|nr:SufD family Fe-S cluster assembly protein [Candidatus Eremiobacteraeota bacterium]
MRYTTIQNWSDNVYNLVTKRAYAHERATVEWIDGNLGCLAGGSRIFTNNNVKPIEEIRPGDHVYSVTPDFEWKRERVVATKKNPPRQTYRVTTIDHREVIATDNHPFLALRKVGRVRQLAWLPLAALRAGDEIGLSGVIPDHGKPYELPFVRRTGKNPFRAPLISDDDLMWLLGFYLGDGYKERSRVYFAVPPADPAEPRVRRLLGDIFGLNECSRAGNVVLRVNSVDLCNFVDAIGFGGGARTKRIPEWVYTLPFSQKRAVVDGYVAADGHVRLNHRNMSITSVNRALLEDVKALALSCGLNPLKVATWSRRERKPLGIEEKLYEHHMLYFGESRPSTPVYFAEVMKIEPGEVVPTFDIEVEGASNFIANGIIVHNSKITMKYPAVYLMGEGAHAEVMSAAFAGTGQHQDAGSKAIHVAPNTTSNIVSRSISKGSGRTSYRGHVRVLPKAHDVRVNVRCDALLLDAESRSDTYPYMDIESPDVTIGHEATVSKVGEDQIFYLMSRGITEDEATALIVNGFFEPFVRELPMEYAVELNRLLALSMEGAIG